MGMAGRFVVDASVNNESGSNAAADEPDKKKLDASDGRSPRGISTRVPTERRDCWSGWKVLM